MPKLDAALSTLLVATVLTVYGIETSISAMRLKLIGDISLQQYLPFTVLKPYNAIWSSGSVGSNSLQQYLPFTVLKLKK